MTNEEMCARYQAGEDSIIPELWDQTKRFIQWKARCYFYSLRAADMPIAFEIDDLIQSGYFALLNAAESFCANREMQFISWLGFYLQNAFRDVAGLNRFKTDAFLHCCSLDEKQGTGNDDDGIPLVDSISNEDIGRVSEEERTVESVYLRDLHNLLILALATSNNARTRSTIYWHYFEGVTYQRIAHLLGTTNGNEEAVAYSGLQQIRRGIYGRKLRAFLDTGSESEYCSTSLRSWKETGLSNPERITMRRIGT